MQEHIERYDEFAKEIAKNGYIVVGHDHLGHGKTATNKIFKKWTSISFSSY